MTDRQRDRKRNVCVCVCVCVKTANHNCQTIEHIQCVKKCVGRVCVELTSTGP